MAPAAAMRPLASASIRLPLLQASRRTIAGLPRPSQLLVPRARTVGSPALRRSFQTSQRNAEAVTPSAPVKPKKQRFRFLRWTWRLTKLSAVAGVAYMGYSIWTLRHPMDQEEPDPSKRTLVILGMLLVLLKYKNGPALTHPCRNWVGFSILAQEA